MRIILCINHLKLIPSSISSIKLPSINLFCENCDSIQTFVYKYKTDRYGDHYVNRGILEKSPLSKQATEYPQNPSVTNPSSGEILNITYNCAGCNEAIQYYTVKISDNNDYLMKIGQFPPWNISIDKNLKKILKKYKIIYKEDR